MRFSSCLAAMRSMKSPRYCHLHRAGRGEPHVCCWMAWAVHPEWGEVINKVKRELSEARRGAAHRRELRQATGAAALSAQCKSAKPTPIKPTITTAIVAKKVHWT